MESRKISNRKGGGEILLGKNKTYFVQGHSLLFSPMELVAMNSGITKDKRLRFGLNWGL